MTQSLQTILKLGEIVKTLRKHAALWIVPMVALTLIALVYGLLKPPVWQAQRRAKAQTIFAELENAVHLAEADLSAATERLEAVETAVGSDLSELRNLNDAATGGGKLRGALALVETDLRTVRSSYQSNQRLQEHLQAAQRDPNQLVAMPNDLLQSQPALRRLKEGLIDAQLLTAQRLGKMSALHPSVQEAVEAEEEIRRHLHGELEVAARGLQVELRMNQSRIGDVERQKRQLELKLQKIATLRARYDNLVTAVRRRSQILEQAQQDLAEARASQAAAQAASLISRRAEADTGDGPVGPGVALLTLSGLAGGLVIGLGLVLLIAPLEQLIGRRRSDQVAEGDRRATDSPAPRETQTNDRHLDDPPAQADEQPVTVRPRAVPPRRGDQWRMPGSQAQTAHVDHGTCEAR